MSYIERELLLIGIDGCISLLYAQAKGEPIQEAAIKLVETTRNYIDSLPAADVAPVRHGRWVGGPVDIDGHTAMECSECHKVRILDEYCSSCGARMDKEDEHETD